MKNKQLGNLGELIATVYLFLKGYHIIHRNFLVKGGEIDIIAEKKDEIVIVEVKTRKNDKFGVPKDAVNHHKQKHIIYATKCYIARNRLFDRKVRFDVLEIYFPLVKIHHIKHAFEIF